MQLRECLEIRVLAVMEGGKLLLGQLLGQKKGQKRAVERRRPRLRL